MPDVEKSFKIIQARAPGFVPRVAFVLGSGLGSAADLVEDVVDISYADLPGFPKPGVQGHAGVLRLGHIEGLPCAILRGRVHLYEGVDAGPLKTMIRTMKKLGAEALFLTNAAGSLIKSYGPGSLVAIRDHINLTGFNPLTGPNDESWGPRFPSMDDCWDTELRDLLLHAANGAGVGVGTGVYIQFTGPSFETPAEIMMAKTMGADIVGMSTAVENIVARHCGLKCVGVSAVTNLAAGLGSETLSHEHTLENAKLAEGKMATVIRAFAGSYAERERAAA